MAKTIYICEKCCFIFERVGEIESCPDCGNSHIRIADSQEAEQYQQTRA